MWYGKSLHTHTLHPAVPTTDHTSYCRGRHSKSYHTKNTLSFVSVSRVPGLSVRGDCDPQTSPCVKRFHDCRLKGKRELIVCLIASSAYPKWSHNAHLIRSTKPIRVSSQKSVRCSSPFLLRARRVCPLRASLSLPMPAGPNGELAMRSNPTRNEIRDITKSLFWCAVRHASETKAYSFGRSTVSECATFCRAWPEKLPFSTRLVLHAGLYGGLVDAAAEAVIPVVVVGEL